MSPAFLDGGGLGRRCAAFLERDAARADRAVARSLGRPKRRGATRKRAAQPGDRRPRRDAGRRPTARRARSGALDERYTALQADVATGAYVVIRIADSGSAMPPDVLAKAFDPFFTTKPVGQGSGLGLSMVFGFMKQVGGHIRLHSQVGHGTTVTLYLPRDAPSGDHPPPAESAFVTFDATGETILLVEDDDMLRELRAEILGELGHRHIAVGDGPAPSRCSSAAAASISCFTDVGLPGMNGRQLAELTRKLRLRTPIVFLTGFAGQAATEKILGANMHLLTKPVEVEVLGDRLRDVLARRVH